MLNFLSKAFLFIGLLFLIVSAYLLYLRYSPHPLTFEGTPEASVALSFDTPKTLLIPSIGVNLPVIPSLIENNTWQTTSRGVSFLQTSPIPGEKGNSVMYGHNWTSLLGRLPQVKPGDKVNIVMDNGSQKEFKVEYTAIVNPDQTYIIDKTEDSRLTIYTCIGFLDSKRFVVVAKPIG